ncbi:hypothetical protein DPMN_145474 [Dreissena polymorpha]|uniref:WAP domain-containing protein n=1 Tax=Dreissena polymorpha TaxID=45954 RepID=A0A9D4F8N0_DREPO|nr:hypothetical protein DPMN_145474 [Dreissena polymorpha]
MFSMNIKAIATVLVAVLAFIKAQLCGIDCGPGFRCAMSRSTCNYPPCPFIPMCIELEIAIPSRWFDKPLTSQVQRHASHTSYNANGVTLVQSPVHARHGECPAPTGSDPCIDNCNSDGECPFTQKCCSNGCGRSCRSAINNETEKPGTCARHLDHSSAGCQRECSTDADCPGVHKCCSTQCGAVCSTPCYYWLEPNQRSSRKYILSKIPFFCRL